MQLFDLGGCAGVLQLGASVLGHFLGHRFHNGGWGTLYQFLGLFQSQAGQLAHGLDDLDLFGSDVLEHNVELGLFLFRLGCGLDLIFVASCFGGPWQISKFGSREQREGLLPKFAKGELIGAAAITEPFAGTDAGSMELRAEKREASYRLVGRKSAVTNAGLADVYATFAEEYMAMPVIKGVKTESEKFPGAKQTLSIEAMMQDGRALQAGTSHHLGQNFARAFDVTFQKEDGTRDYVWATSWGVSTRLVGALIMAHSDDKGLILPPRLAPIHAVIVPIWMKDHQVQDMKRAGAELFETLRREHPDLTFRLDDREQYKPGWKFAEWEQRGVPVRIELGPRDLEKDQVVVVRRDTGEKTFLPRAELAGRFDPPVD